MAPINSRQLLVWTLPTIAALLSYLWYKRKRIGVLSDPGDNKQTEIIELIKDEEKEVTTLPINIEKIDEDNQNQKTPNKSFSRSLSGIETTPIDIVIPKELRSIKTTPIVISDEDLDFEIEKVKSMKNINPIELFKNKNSPNKSNNNYDNTDNKNIIEQEEIINKDIEQIPVINKVEIEPFECKELTPTKKIMSTATMVPSPTTSSSSKKGKNKKKNSNNKVKKEMAVVEEKLNTLKIEEKNNEELINNRQSSERDSANHSPSDVMLASPSLSSISDNHSEGSNDSGKGGSDVATPPPSRTPGTDGSVNSDHNNLSLIYEFLIPQGLVGKLIGKRGAFVNLINSKAHAQILVKKHPTDDKLKVCSIEGVQNDIDKALKMIRERFPPKKFPDVTLEQVTLTHPIPTVPLYSDHLYLKLVAGINNDTIMSCMVNPSHLFLQQPTHPTFPNLNILANCMNACYLDVESPLLPNPIPENTVCAAYSVNSWYRAMILSTDIETDTSYVKFLDYGGYAYVENSLLRQIRGDFMLLPFQAAECFLANVKPIGETWHEDSYDLVANLTKGSIIYTQVIEYSEDDTPLVHCYVVVGPNQLVFLNQELVNQGFAEWISYDEATGSSES